MFRLSLAALLAIALPVVAFAQAAATAPAMQSGNSASGTGGTTASAPGSTTQAEQAAGNMQPQGQQSGAPSK